MRIIKAWKQWMKKKAKKARRREKKLVECVKFYTNMDKWEIKMSG